MLVITPEASAESKRLATQGTRIVPIQSTREILRSITAIDGAVMLDTSGVCHAIGVILDGEAIDFGNPARGARYNSSLRYVAHMEKRGIPCAAIGDASYEREQDRRKANAIYLDESIISDLKKLAEF